MNCTGAAVIGIDTPAPHSRGGFSFEKVETMNRTLELRTNNGYDTILLVEDGRVVGQWDTAGDGVLDNYSNPGSLDYWEPNEPAATDPEAYGTIKQ